MSAPESREGLNLHGHGVGGDGFPVDAVWDLNRRDARQTGGGLRRQRLQVQFSQAADKTISAETMAIPWILQAFAGQQGKSFAQGVDAGNGRSVMVPNVWPARHTRARYNGSSGSF